MKVNIICVDNGAGLSKNMRILEGVFRAAGVHVTITRMPDPDPRRDRSPRAERTFQRAANLSRILFRRPFPFDLNVFVEGIFPEWLPCARRNWLLPNEEWFLDEFREYLSSVDLVICKTRHAQEQFNQLGCATEYISFTSEDRFDPSIPKAYDLPFHLAGKSLYKGTKALVDLWGQHPEWPCLTVLQWSARENQYELPNVEYVSRYVDDAELRKLQNERGLHLCPSEAEAWGHYIVEGMSACSVVVVTNAPPMNELATPERALQVEYNASRPMRLSSRYFVDPISLEEKVGEAIDMDTAARTRMGFLAREWFIENDRFFRRRLTEVITGC